MTRRHNDGGFTLIELLITVVILGVITLPLADLVISYFTNTATTTSRLAESHDEQIAAAYFSQDVAAVGTRDNSGAVHQSVYSGGFPGGSCGGSAAPANQVLLLKSDNIAYANSTATTTVNSVAYVIATSGNERQLHRIFCVGPLQTSDVVLIHNLDPGVVPQVACSPNCVAVSTITLTVGISSSSGSGQPYTLALTGTRRQSA